MNSTQQLRADLASAFDGIASRMSVQSIFDDQATHSQLLTNGGVAIVTVGELNRLAGGRRWKQSVSSESSTGARGVRTYLDSYSLTIYSPRGVAVAGDNGTKMTSRVLGNLRGDDFVVVVDSSTPLGQDLLHGTITPHTTRPLPTAADGTATEDRIRLANLEDVLAVIELLADSVRPR